MTWHVSPRYGIRPDSNAKLIPDDPGLRLDQYMAGGSGTTSYLLGRSLRHEVPRAHWINSESPGDIWLIVEISDMPVLTGEDESAFKGFPWNVCFYAACAGFQSEDFWHELRSNGCAPPWEPWFIWDAMHGGHAAPVFQFDCDTEEVAISGAQQVVPWVEDNFMRLAVVPVNKIGSNSWDFMRGELVSRPR